VIHSSNFLWLLTVAGGPIILGIAVIYAVMRRRRLKASEKLRQHEGTERLYQDDPTMPPGH